MKRKLLALFVLLITVFVYLGCDSSDSEGGFEGTLYNCSDGSCWWAQDDFDFYVDNKKIDTIETGSNKKVSLSEGSHTFHVTHVDSDKVLGEPYSFAVEEDGWWFRFGCDDGTKPDSTGFGKKEYASDFKIDHVRWSYDNLDTSFWSIWGQNKTETMFFDLDLLYSGNIAQYEILYVYSQPEGTTNRWFWTVKDAESGVLDTANKVLIDYYLRWSDTGPNGEEDGTALRIGKHNMKVVFADGSVYKREYTINNPGLTTFNGNAAVYSDDYSGTAPSNYSSAIKRATDVTATKSGTSPNEKITVTFKVSDSRITQSWFWLYKSGKYLGWSGHFVNNDGSIASNVNSGSNLLHKDGTVNTVELTSSNISFDDSSFSISNIEYIIVVTRDGDQYNKTEADYGIYHAMSKATQVQ